MLKLNFKAQMKNLASHIEQFFVRSEAWMIWVILLIAANMQTIGLPPHTWGQFIGAFFTLVALFSPFIIFEGIKKFLQTRLPKSQYIGVWLLIHASYASVLFSYGESMTSSVDRHIQQDYINLVCYYVIALPVVLEFNRLYLKPNQHLFGNRKINLDLVISIGLLVWAFFLSLLITSDYESFIQTHLVDFSINFYQVVHRLPILFATTTQIYLIFMSGFLFFWLNRHFLIPRLLKRHGIIVYIMSSLATLFVLYPIIGQIILNFPLQRLIPVFLPSETSYIFHIANLGFPFMILAVSLPIILVIQWFQQHHQIVSLEKQQVQTELDLLKQQINPHFFFNTLNNLYALSRKKSEQTPEVILQLSELMRYVIYKGQESEVNLSDEIKYIKDYLDLQQIRLHQSIDLKIDEQIDSPHQKIAPLLLITFVENAFKHGIEPAERETFLSISIRATESKIQFSCINSYESIGDNQPGIGLDNLKRRLELIYPNQHQLTTQKENNIYKAVLTLQVHETKSIDR